MSANKLDRTNLRRQVQRVDPYSSLVSKKKSIFKNNSLGWKISRTGVSNQKPDFADNNKENEEDESNRCSNVPLSSPSNSSSSSSSDGSEYSQSYLLPSQKTDGSSLQNNEMEVSSIMTRSAMKKYASVGAIHNKVDLKQELKVMKRWSSTISYPTPAPPDSHLLLKNVISRSLNEVMSFCKNTTKPNRVPKLQDNAEPWELGDDSMDVIDLSPFLTQEPVIINGSDETRITLHLDDNLLPQQIINIISLNEENGQSGALVIQDESEAYDTIALHSGNTYWLDNKYFSNPVESTCFNQGVTTVPKNHFPHNPMMAVHNDHTYAQKCPENMSKSLTEDETSQVNFENSLNDLLLNTAILKCLICGETPQEITSLIENAQYYF